MALTRQNEFDTGTTLTEEELEGEFDYIYANGTDVAFPLTKSVSAGDFNVTSIGELGFTSAGNASAAGRLRRNSTTLTWHDGTSASVILNASNLHDYQIHSSEITGLTLSNNSSDADHDIDIAIGGAVSSDTALADREFMSLTTAITKQIDAAWAVGTNAGGLDTGAVGNNTWYHVWLIKRTDTDVVDALFSTSASSPTMPANYDKKRRIGSVLTNSSANIISFVQFGDDFYWASPVLDINATQPGTSAVTATLSVPLGVTTKARMNVSIFDTAASGSIYISSPSVNDLAASQTAAPLGQVSLDGVTGSDDFLGVAEAWTNTSSQVRYRINFDSADSAVRIATVGWMDLRGK